MRRIVVIAVLFFAVAGPARGQWGCTLYGGLAVPTLASWNAPELRVSLATGLRGHWTVDSSRWSVTGEVWQVRHLKEENPDVEVIPLDTLCYVKRYQLIPFMLGAEYRFAVGTMPLTVAFGASLGGYFRYIHFRKRVTMQMINDIGESGWGMAGKVSAEVTLWRRLSFGVWFMAMGNPFESPRGMEYDDGEIGNIEYGDYVFQRDRNMAFGGLYRMEINRIHRTLDGYGQCFGGVVMGYKF